MMIDLCVVSYNTKEKLTRLYETLTQSMEIGLPFFRLLIADNGSKDGSVEHLKAMVAAGFLGEGDVFFNDNIGYARACNQLAARGESDIIGLLNSDIWFTHQDLAKIQTIFDENPEIHILGPKQRDEQGKIRHAGILGTMTAPKHRGWNQLDPNDELYRDRVEAVTVSGSAYFIRRSTWDALTDDPEYQKFCYRTFRANAEGAFLPTPHYFEETWCSYFARHRGYGVYYDGTVSIGHSWHASHPIGSPADLKFKVSQKLFRAACDEMGIEHD